MKSNVAALFTVAKTWKQSKCPSTDEHIKKMCVRIYIYISTMEYYVCIYIYIYTMEYCVCVYIYTHWNIVCICIYIYTMEYYSTSKQNETMPIAATWMDLSYHTGRNN